MISALTGDPATLYRGPGRWDFIIRGQVASCRVGERAAAFLRVQPHAFSFRPTFHRRLALRASEREP